MKLQNKLQAKGQRKDIIHPAKNVFFEPYKIPSIIPQYPELYVDQQYTWMHLGYALRSIQQQLALQSHSQNYFDN